MGVGTSIRHISLAARTEAARSEGRPSGIAAIPGRTTKEPRSGQSGVYANSPALVAALVARRVNLCPVSPSRAILHPMVALRPAARQISDGSPDGHCRGQQPSHLELGC